MQFMISLSAYDPKEFRWVTFTGVRPATIKKGKAVLELKTGSVYGFCLYRRGFFWLIPKSDLDVRYTVSADDLRKLLARSSGYEGRVKNKVVENGKPGSVLKSDPDATPPKPKRVLAKEARQGEPTDYTALIRNAGLPLPNTIKFIGHKQDLTGHEVQYYWDVTKSVDAMGLGDKWESRVETMVMKSVKRGVVVGATDIMFNNRVVHAVIVCE